MKRLWSAGAVAVGFIAFGFGIVHADTGFSGMALMTDTTGTNHVQCHVLNTGKTPLNQVTITINTESGKQLAIERFINVLPGHSVKEDIDSGELWPRNIYCRVDVLNSTTWNGTLDIQTANPPGSVVIDSFHK